MELLVWDGGAGAAGDGVLKAYRVTGSVVYIDTTPCDCCEGPKDEAKARPFDLRLLASDPDAAIDAAKGELDSLYGDEDGDEWWEPGSDVVGAGRVFIEPEERWLDFVTKGCPGWTVEELGSDVAAALLGHPELPLAFAG